MIKGYVVAGALGMLFTVAFYEGKNALAKGHTRSAAAHTAVAQAPSSTGSDAIEDARQQLADSLMACQTELLRKEHDEAPVEVPPEPAVIEQTSERPSFEGSIEEPTQEDWKALAQDGEIVIHRLCNSMNPHDSLDEAHLRASGVDERDAPAVAEALKRLSEEQWASDRADCAAVLGIGSAAVERIGADLCEAVLTKEGEKDAALFRRVGEIRGGLRDEGAHTTPIEHYFLTMSRQVQRVESELARRLGRERARQLLNDETICTTTQAWPLGADDDRPL